MQMRNTDTFHIRFLPAEKIHKQTNKQNTKLRSNETMQMTTSDMDFDSINRPKLGEP